MKHEYTLYDLLEEYRVVIPRIQRDYAQGRRIREVFYIRKNFLNEIAKADKNNKLSLDYVFGVQKDSDIFYPLDGQQRLTTLWLVYWYLAFKTGRLKDLDYLKKFSYQTRITSRKFCDMLFSSAFTDCSNPFNVGNIAEFITGQNCFYSDWMKDPTINSMITVLGGSVKNEESMSSTDSEEADSEENEIDDNDIPGDDVVTNDAITETNAEVGDIAAENCVSSSNENKPETVFGTNIDSIEQIFSGMTEDEMNNRLNLLISSEEDDKIITFVLKKLNKSELPVSDDLYIKMNARGKLLTHFENFKADFVTENKNYDTLIKNSSLDYLIDVEWTEFLWEYAKNHKDWFEEKNGISQISIDDIFFSFFNRFTLDELCILKDISSSNYENKKSLNRDEKSSERKLHFNILYGTGLKDDTANKTKADDSQIAYSEYEVYKNYLSDAAIAKIQTIFGFLCANKKCVNEKAVFTRFDILSRKTDDIFWTKKCVKDNDGNEKYENYTLFSFFPRFEDKRLKDTTQEERVYFHAVVKILSTIDYDISDNKFEEKLDAWLKFVWRLIRNNRVDTISAMIENIRAIDSIGDACADADWNLNEGLIKYGEDKKYIEKETSESSAEAQVDNDVNNAKQVSRSNLENQILEEIWKAKLSFGNKDLEQKFRETEEKKWFEGTIRFLLWDENGKWTSDFFDTKKSICEQIFSEQNSTLNLSKAFLRLFENFEELYKVRLNAKKITEIDLPIFTSEIKDIKANSWICNIFWVEKLSHKIHRLLTEYESLISENYSYGKVSQDYKEMIESNLVSFIQENSKSGKFLVETIDPPAIKKKVQNSSDMDWVYVRSDRLTKSKELRETTGVEINSELERKSIFNKDKDGEKIESDYIFGKAIFFKYNEKRYVWYLADREERICLEDKYSDDAAIENYQVWDKDKDLKSILDELQS